LWAAALVDSIPPMLEMRRVILVGAFTFAEETSDLCRMADIEVAAWIEGLDRARVDPAHDPPILWVDDQAAFEPDLPILPAIGSVARKGIVTRLVGEGRSLATLIHASAVIAPSAVIEPGCVVFPLAVVAARARIGEGTVLNRGALVGHHTVVGPYSFLGPGANVCGLVTIGEQVHVGPGAIVRDRTKVGDGATVGMGAVVVGDVAAGTTVIGLPARAVERRGEAGS